MKFSYRTALALGVAALGFAPGAWAQGCVLCYTSLASSGPAAMHAFQMAMFALLIFLAVFLIIFRGARAKAPTGAMQRNRAHRWQLSSNVKPLEGRA
jgi:hypothetical protein